MDYKVKYLILSKESKEIQACLFKRFSCPCESEVRRFMEALGYCVLMTDVVSTPGEILVQCSYL